MAVLQAGLLLVAMFANAIPRNNSIRIKVLDSETRSVDLGGNDVPKNCDGVNFDAYCNNGKSALLTNTLLVQEGNGTPFRVACTVDARYSRCVPLPKGEIYDAIKGKRGLTVYYRDDKGKARSQFYTLVAEDEKAAPPPSAGAVATEPVPPAAAPPRNSAAPPVAKAVAEKVKCNFSSTPPGADITLDGKYVGNTPSEIGLSPGTHDVVISMAGFAEWKRELTVAPDSVVNVTASLQKTQP
jgi:hypothetical protein